MSIARRLVLLLALCQCLGFAGTAAILVRSSAQDLRLLSAEHSRLAVVDIIRELESMPPTLGDGEALQALAAEIGQRSREGKWPYAVLRDYAGAESVSVRPLLTDRGGLFDIGVQHPAAKSPLQRAGRPIGSLELTLPTHELDRRIALLAALVGGLFVATSLLMAAGLWWLRGLTLAPLKRMYAQIEGMSAREWLSVPVPAALEWVGLSKRLNVLSARLRNVFNERDDAVREMNERLSQDSLTGTANREAFMQVLTHHLQAADGDGGAAILQVRDLEALNQRHGRHRGDELLIAVATMLRARLQLLRGEGKFLVARMRGADFAVLVPQCTPADWQACMEAIADGLNQLEQEGLAELSPLAWLGGTPYRRGEIPGDVLARIDHLVMLAQQQGVAVAKWRTGTGLDADDLHVRMRNLPLERWRSTIERALDAGQVKLVGVQIADAQGTPWGRLMRLEMRFDRNNLIDHEVVVPAAARCGRLFDLELRALALAVAELDPASPLLQVLPVSMQTVVRPTFAIVLERLLSGTAANARSRLCLLLYRSPSDEEADRALELLVALSARLGFSIGQQQEDMRHNPMLSPQAQRLRIVRLHPALLGETAHSSNMRDFVHLFGLHAGRLDVRLMASSATQPEDIARLSKLGVKLFEGVLPPPSQRSLLATAGRITTAGTTAGTTASAGME